MMIDWERVEMMYEPDEPHLLIDGRVEGLRHICEGTDRTQDCRACDVEQHIEETSAFDPAEWSTTPEPAQEAA